MRGVPMNAATKTLLGSAYTTRGLSACWSTPPRSTATRSPSDMASAWSWVT